MSLIGDYSKFNKFAENYPVLARATGLPIALYVGFKASLKVPSKSLDSLVSALSLITFSTDPKPGTNRLLLAAESTARAITILAFSPLTASIMGAATATMAFTWIIFSPETFGQKLPLPSETMERRPFDLYS